MKDLRKLYTEIGALCGHEDPDAFADFMLAPPCKHDGIPTYDPATCPAPCGQTHEYWCDCGYPIGGCPIVTEGGDHA